MKIFVNRRIRRHPWGGGIHFLSGFADYLLEHGHSITNEFENDVNAILMIDPRPDDGFGDINQLFQYKAFLHSKGNNVKVFHRINDADVNRNTNFLVELNIKSNNLIADHTIFISEWLQKHYQERGFSRDSVIIKNGCNHDWYYPSSFLKEDSPIKVVTHHWSDNYNKGFDAYIELDKQLSKRKDIVFTYIGRYYKGYAPQNTNLIPPMYGMDLGNELRKNHVYITASRWEPCGMHHIEASSCGLPVVYHRDGGAIGEICKNHGVEFSNVEKVCDVIEEAFEKRKDLEAKINYASLDNKNVNKLYYDFILKNI